VKTLRVVCALFWLGCGWCAGDAACQNTRQHLAALEKTPIVDRSEMFTMVYYGK